MDDDELTEVASCNIRHIMDFRSSFEKDRLPDPSLPGAEYHHMNAMSLPDGTEVDLSPKGIGAGMFTKENGDRFMEHFYGTLPFSPAYREMFDFIKRDEVPVLFHCTAGKDRAGTAAVIIEEILGIPREVIIADYLKTNEYLREDLMRLTALVKRNAGTDSPLADESLRYLFGADEDFIRSYYETVEDRYGSMDGLISEGLGLSDRDRMELREMYLR